MECYDTSIIYLICYLFNVSPINRYNVDTFNICLPLRPELQQYKQIDEISLQLDYLCNEYPNIITNSEKDIKREKYWYSLILNKCEKQLLIQLKD